MWASAITPRLLSLLFVCQISSVDPECLRCVWPDWSTCFTSRRWRARSTCAATSKTHNPSDRCRSQRATLTFWHCVCVHRVLLKKSGCRTPRIELEDMGPSFDFVMRRSHMASDDLYKTAHRQPRGVKVPHTHTHTDSCSSPNSERYPDFMYTSYWIVSQMITNSNIKATWADTKYSF